MDKDKFLDTLRKVYRSQNAGNNYGAEAFSSLTGEDLDDLEKRIETYYVRPEDLKYRDAIRRLTNAEQAYRDPMAASNRDGQNMGQDLIDIVLNEISKRR